MQIPKLGLDAIVVAGVDRDDLKRGPGHYPQTRLPGQLGNAAIAGHRTSYGEPFAYIDQLQAGDEITVTTPAGTFIYVVDDSRIVSPSDTYVLDTDDDSASRLTLTSCHPRYSASQRIAVSAELAGTGSSPVGEPVINYGRPDVDKTDSRAVDTIPGEPVDPASTSGLLRTLRQEPRRIPRRLGPNPTPAAAPGRGLRIPSRMPSRTDGSPIAALTHTWRCGDCCSSAWLSAATWCAGGSGTTGAARC
ncbi:MAG: class E sortase [Acidimicrobiia bacterium]|nr:class E sortase [Acidimicrobiia bacterium]